MKPKLNVGDLFHMDRYLCTITAISSFSGVLHYGFRWCYDDTGKVGCGWMPCIFVENFAGYVTH